MAPKLSRKEKIYTNRQHGGKDRKLEEVHLLHQSKKCRTIVATEEISKQNLYDKLFCKLVWTVFCTEIWIKPNTLFPSILVGKYYTHQLYLMILVLLIGIYQGPVCLYLIYCRLNTLQCVKIWIKNSCASLNVCCCFLKCQHYKVAVLCIYKSPSIDVSKYWLFYLRFCFLQIHTFC